MSTTLTFSSTLWHYSAGKGSWYFITLPKDDADFIRWVQEKIYNELSSLEIDVITTL